MKLTNHVAERIARRLTLDGFTVLTADIWNVYWHDSTTSQDFALASAILQEFDEYGVETPREETRP